VPLRERARPGERSTDALRLRSDTNKKNTPSASVKIRSPVAGSAYEKYDGWLATLMVGSGQENIVDIICYEIPSPRDFRRRGTSAPRPHPSPAFS